jgi:hypothetical protein
MSARNFRTSWDSQSDNAPNQRGGINMQCRSRIWIGLAAVALLIASGCSTSEPRVPVFSVSGKVSFHGKSPAGARVVLFPDKKSSPTGGAVGVAPTGEVKSDGTFSVSSYDADDGAPEGEYVATIQWNKYDEKLGGFGPNVIPKKYASATTSPVRVSVKGGPATIPPIEIKN